MAINKHFINSIYRATEGEGIFLGRPQIFVRYQGCNIGCVNCDSKETWEFETGDSYDLNDVLAKIYSEGFSGLIKNVSITGGDPLHPKHVPQVLELVKKLKELGFYINIEAAGTRVAPEIFDLVDYISFDIKTPSTHVKTPLELLKKMHRDYAGKFQVKAVIANLEDYQYVEKYREAVNLEFNTKDIPWVLTPCYNPEEKFPMDRFVNVMMWNEANGGHFRVIGQQHKWVYGPDKKEV